MKSAGTGSATSILTGIDNAVIAGGHSPVRKIAANPSHATLALSQVTKQVSI